MRLPNYILCSSGDRRFTSGILPFASRGHFAFKIVPGNLVEYTAMTTLIIICEVSVVDALETSLLARAVTQKPECRPVRLKARYYKRFNHIVMRFFDEDVD